MELIAQASSRTQMCLLQSHIARTMMSNSESYEYVKSQGKNIPPNEFMMESINWGDFPLRFSFSKGSDIKRYLEQTYAGILDKDIITDKSKVNRQNFERVATLSLINHKRSSLVLNAQKIYNIIFSTIINKN